MPENAYVCLIDLVSTVKQLYLSQMNLRNVLIVPVTFIYRCLLLLNLDLVHLVVVFLNVLDNNVQHCKGDYCSDENTSPFENISSHGSCCLNVPSRCFLGRIRVVQSINLSIVKLFNHLVFLFRNMDCDRF